MGYNNAQTASACFGPVKKKLLASAGESAGTPTPKKKAAAATPKIKDKAESVAKSAVKKVSPRKAEAESGASETVGKYVGETVDSVISGAAAVFAGKSPFGGGRSKVSFLTWFF